ncbi:phosphatidylinositide phosphatase SAC2 [Cricetulus griseus]|uniref:Phosphatidylinositide phosphatase SAC2 n=1 Tax=Cricetulus griseus TaxID=10029 RepID=A0A061IB01_CRIGR|nr:phosphatidylinositide phosphatase SAC2 [Cricetulus griseus]
MELFQAKDHYILQQGERALWCSRRDGGLQLRPALDRKLRVGLDILEKKLCWMSLERLGEVKVSSHHLL